MEDLKSSLLFLLSVLLLIFLRIWGSVLLLRRANKNIILKLREKQALSPEQAISREDLGMKKDPLFVRMIKAKDNRLQALDFLSKAGIITITEEGLIYLSEKRLAEIQAMQNRKEFRFLLPREL